MNPLWIQMDSSLMLAVDQNSVCFGDAGESGEFDDEPDEDRIEEEVSGEEGKAGECDGAGAASFSPPTLNPLLSPTSHSHLLHSPLPLTSCSHLLLSSVL